jgi:hypothetical protein
MRYVAPIVEGHGEVEAVPALLHRIARSCAFADDLRVNPPIRVRSASFINDDDYFRRQVTLAAAKAAHSGGSVLILLDCDDDCPCTLGPLLLDRAKRVRENVDVIVALAYREYETWFISAVSSLGGLHGLPHNLQAPQFPDNIRNAKGWLGGYMNERYDPVIHQLEFTRAFDLDEARSNRSFDRLYLRFQEFLNG